MKLISQIGRKGRFIRLSTTSKKSKRLKIYDLDPAQTAELQKAMKPVHDKFSEVVPTKWIKEIKMMK